MWRSALVAGVLVGAAVTAAGSPAQPAAGCAGWPDRYATERGSFLARRALAALTRAPGSDLATLVTGRGAPLHAWCTPGGALVVAWEREGALTFATVDGRGELLGWAETGALGVGLLDPRRAPVLRPGGDGWAVLLTQADGIQLRWDLGADCVEVVLDGASRRVADAEERARAGEHAAAADELSRAVAEDPTNADAWRGLARALERSGDRAAARDTLALAAARVHGGRIKPVSMDWRVTDPRARLGLELAQSLELEGDQRGRDAALREVARLYPCMEEATLLRARAALASDATRGPGLADDVLRATIARLETPRARAAAHLDAAKLLEDVAAYELSRPHLVAALELGEDREVVLRRLARVDARRGDTQSARALLLQLRERWLMELATIEDERRLERSHERIAELDAELAALPPAPGR